MLELKIPLRLNLMTLEGIIEGHETSDPIRLMNESRFDHLTVARALVGLHRQYDSEVAAMKRRIGDLEKNLAEPGARKRGIFPLRDRRPRGIFPLRDRRPRGRPRK